MLEYDPYALSRFEDIWKASADTRNLTAAHGTTSAHLLTKVQPVTPMPTMRGFDTICPRNS